MYQFNVFVLGGFAGRVFMMYGERDDVTKFVKVDVEGISQFSSIICTEMNGNCMLNDITACCSVKLSF
jgi:hypothetical protein